MRGKGTIIFLTGDRKPKLGLMRVPKVKVVWGLTVRVKERGSGCQLHRRAQVFIDAPTWQQIYVIIAVAKWKRHSYQPDTRGPLKLPHLVGKDERESHDGSEIELMAKQFNNGPESAASQEQSKQTGLLHPVVLKKTAQTVTGVHTAGTVGVEVLNAGSRSGHHHSSIHHPQGNLPATGKSSLFCLFLAGRSFLIYIPDVIIPFLQKARSRFREPVMERFFLRPKSFPSQQHVSISSTQQEIPPLTFPQISSDGLDSVFNGSAQQRQQYSFSRTSYQPQHKYFIIVRAQQRLKITSHKPRKHAQLKIYTPPGGYWDVSITRSYSLSSISDDGLNQMNLSMLILSNCNFSVIPSNAFSGLDNLLILQLSYNPIYEIQPYAFKNLTSLQTLTLDHMQLRFVNRSAFRGLPNLQTLDITYNKIVINQLFINLHHLHLQ
uniref:LRRCT domain-containing protein n=1 Tax=Branchiostoma floridae TaxID=7739 RepID=C3ZD68_BRAFL|eukprot:XP_002593568.1 hypothetical protein BRAFLDRAFT_88485 [Branchiostoma floridae]